MAELHKNLGGKVTLYKREHSRHWQCSTFLEGKKRCTTTKETHLGRAKEVAEDWYLTLRGKQRRGELLNEKTFKEAADLYTREYEVITRGGRSPKWVEGHKALLRLHWVPFFGPMCLSQITAGTAQESATRKKPP